MSDKRQRTTRLAKSVNDQTKETSSGANYWLCLSDEMALIILRHLSQKDLVTVSLINKKFRDLSRDDSLWTELTLDYQYIKKDVYNCRKLVERCKRLESLEITNKSRPYYSLRSLDIMSVSLMSVAILAKRSLKRLDVDSSIQNWTEVALAKLGQMEQLKSITMSFDPKYQNRVGALQFPKLEQLEVLCVQLTRETTSVIKMLKNVLQHFTKLKKVDIRTADVDTLVHLLLNNPDLKELRLKFLVTYPPNCPAGILLPFSGFRLQIFRSIHPEIDITGI